MKHLIIILFTLLPGFLFAQIFETVIRRTSPDSPLVYITPPPFTSTGSNHMVSSPGTNTSMQLKETPDSFYYNSNFSHLTKASLLNPSVDKYPVSAVVNIQYASGILVHERFVLTALHVCGNTGCNVHPAFDNGIAHPVFGSTKAKAVYSFDVEFFNVGGYRDYDMALVELEEPIGNKTGWVGLGYSNDKDFFMQQTFYIFGYPRDYHTKPSPFNGDTMIQSFGKIDSYFESFNAYKANARFRTRHYTGHSGSGFFTPHKALYTTYGQFPSGDGVLLLNDSSFYAFKYIIDSVNNHYGLLTDVAIKEKPGNIKVYPNPATNKLVIEMERDAGKNFQYQIIDLTGREISSGTIKNNGTQTPIDVSHLPNGLYFIRVEAMGEIYVKRFLKE